MSTTNPFDVVARLRAEKARLRERTRPDRDAVVAVLQAHYSDAPLSWYLSSDGDAYHVAVGGREVAVLRIVGPSGFAVFLRGEDLGTGATTDSSVDEALASLAELVGRALAGRPEEAAE